MPEPITTNTPSVEIAARTLLACGYIFDGGGQRQPTHFEVPCHRESRLGAKLDFLVAISVKEEFDPEVIDNLVKTARADCRVPILIGSYTTDHQIGWFDFLDALGGAVPSWRALAPTFKDDVFSAARNKVPPGWKGEAWALFEDLAADGLEFCLSHKVRRQGARRRGKPVSDMLAQIPDGALIVVDAKAAGDGFGANWPALRPLVEYVKKQQQLQRGHNEVICALVISSAFDQQPKALAELSQAFFSETGIPVNFLTAETLSGMVQSLTKRPDIRNAVRWRRLFAGGSIEFNAFERLIKEATEGRYERGEG